MSRASDKANSVMNAVEQLAALYRVPTYRMQSRVFDVIAKHGGTRPLLVGRWTDSYGTVHTAGMADLLLTPTISLLGPVVVQRVAVPLWVECKAGEGRQTPDQKAFEDHVILCGAHYLLARDCADSVYGWFKLHGVIR